MGTYLITGVGRGIGQELARALLARGERVIGTLRDPAQVSDILSGFVANGQLKLLALDVRDEASIAEAARHLDEPVDVLINNAGMSVRQPAHVISLEDWETVIDTNLTSAFICTKAVYPAMKQTGGGMIINIGSMMSIFGAGFAPAYAASKGGIVQFTKSIALSWAVDNIQANAILPGWIDTALTVKAREQVPGLNENVLARTPAKRWGTGDDLAGTAVFLASSASDFVTGTAIPVDGGYSVQS